MIGLESSVAATAAPAQGSRWGGGGDHSALHDVSGPPAGLNS